MRLVVWAVAFAVGDACAVAGAIGGRPAAAAIAAGALGLGAAWALRRGWPAVGGAAAWLALGAILGTRAARPPDLPPALAAALGSIEPARDDPHADDPHADDPHAIVGVVERGPEQTGTGARLQVEVTALDGVPATGILGLSVASGWPDFGPGEIIACRARLRPLRGTRNPGVPDPVIPLRAAGLDALAGVAGAAAIQRLAEPTGIGPRRAAFLARRALRAAIARVVRGEPAAFLRTAVLGERRGVSSEIEDGFRAAGATHVLSVSGLHLAAVAALFFLAVRAIAARIPRLALYVDPRAIAAAASLPAIALFTLITGEAVATERSALMLAIGMGALLCGRRASPAPTIAATALVLLCARPLEILDVSLQLSVASVSGIALVARRLGRRSPKGASWARRALGWLFRFGVATAAATAATAPLVAHCFAEVAPLAPLGNLALVPLVEMAVVPLGLAGSAAGALWPPLGRPLLGLAGIAARLTLAVAAAFRAYAPVWVCRAPNVLETLALTAAGALALVALALVGRWRLGGRLALGAALACAAVASVSLTARDLARRHGKALTVTFLDVGQGDAAVLEAPGGAAMLVDGGGTRDGAFDTGARIVEPFLRARGIGRLDVVALSHPHPDHLNGLFRVLERFDVGAFWSSGDDGRNPEYRRLIALAKARNIPTPVVAATKLGEVAVEPLGPLTDGRIEAPPGLSVNDASLVLRAGFAGRAVLFAGDLEADGEGELTGRRDLGQPIGADILKVPHHGSRTSSSDELVAAVAPKVAIISLGWRNQFHFPAPEVVDRYLARGTRVLRTDRDGAITVTIGPDGVLGVRCERGCRDQQPAAGLDR